MTLGITNILLGSKNVFSKIWLAAHWEKKLKRCQVCQIDIEKCVKEMFEREIVLDLRVSGHLLVGIVRIFSRKTVYLLNECTDVFSRVQVFRSVIELPQQKLEMSKHKVTLPNVLDKLDDFHFNLMDDAIFQSHQSRQEEITLKEATGNQRLIDDELFDNFEETNGEMLFETELDEVILLPQNRAPTEMMEQNFSEELFPTDDLDFNGHLDYQENEAHISHCVKPISLRIMSRETNSYQSSFTLEPLSDVVSTPLRLRRGKRKLLIDSEKKLRKDAFDDQLIDTSDITIPLDMAPPSKRLMTLKEIGGAEQLLHLPAHTIRSVTLVHLFKRNLKTRKIEEDESAYEEEESEDSSEIPRGNLFHKGISLPNDGDKMMPHVIDCGVVEELAEIHEESHSNFMNGGSDFPVADFNVIPNSSDSSTGFIEQNQNDPSPQMEEENFRFLQERMDNLAHTLQLAFNNKREVKFSQLVRNQRRQTVVQMFTSLLMLKKYEIVEVMQKENYGEIFITPGQNDISAAQE